MVSVWTSVLQGPGQHQSTNNKHVYHVTAPVNNVMDQSQTSVFSVTMMSIMCQTWTSVWSPVLRSSSATLLSTAVTAVLSIVSGVRLVTSARSAVMTQCCLEESVW